MNSVVQQRASIASAMGQRALPAMERLPTRIPSLKSAILCSADGFNLCSLGVDAACIGRLAALSTSLFTVGESTLQTLQAEGAPARNLDQLALMSEDTQIVGVKIPARHASHLVLMVEAERTTLGIILVGARSTAAEIAAQFA